MICRRESGYQQLKCPQKITDENYDVYTITSEPLPSHMRTMLPASEKHMDTYIKMSSPCRLKYVLLTVIVFVVSSVLLTVSLIYGITQTQTSELLQINHHTKPKLNHTIISDITVHKSINYLQRKQEVYPAYITRTPCVNGCWAYAAFKFKSQCMNGFCKCKGVNYDSLTCLPHVDDCNIMVNSPSVAKASLFGKTQKTFTCKSRKKSSSDTHVLSIFGNHRSATTKVKVTGNTSKPKVLILVNYHPIHWEIQVNTSIQLQQLVLVSFNHLSKTKVSFKDASSRPVIKRLFSLTGYGQDRFGGHTPELMKNIVHEFGNMASFTGTSHADGWEIDFDDTEDLQENVN